ncbi:MAG: DNA primase DnaG [Candidatus Hodarchaeota archaeon]
MTDRDDFTTTKYIIGISIDVDGIVERPDVVGAIFGQTEGLLGGELDLRELQKTGRIGRIGVNLETKAGKVVGNIVIPSSLDRAETAILAAAIEIIDRVGPCTARLRLNKIEDIRESKREKIIHRAVGILRDWNETVAPESQEITDAVLNAAQIGAIAKYGPEGLPAGPSIDESDSIIILEGRADVLNLLRHGFKNIIAVEGTNIPDTIVELSRRKTTTAFMDGDRGGELILKELVEVAEVDYISRAPSDKDVEDLTRKEIIKCLRNKVPVEQYAHVEKPKREKPKVEKPKREEPKREKEKRYKLVEKPKTPQVKEPRITPPKELAEHVGDVREKLEAVILDQNAKILKRTSVGELAEILTTIDDVDAVVFDGIITQRLIDIAFEKGIKKIIGARVGKIQKKPIKVSIFTFADVAE